MVKVSVVVPVHNTEKYLRQCVTSLLNQTLGDELEIILVENASTDDSLALCRQLTSEDKRVRYISLDKGDLSTARNAGVRLATADFVGFIDSDDEVLPEMYERMYRAAEKNGADMVNCNYVKVYNSLRKPKYQYCEDGREMVLSPKEMAAMNLREQISQSACTILVRKSLVEKIKFPENTYYEDRASTFMLCAEAAKCVQINKSFYIYHQYRGNIIRKSKQFRQSYDCATADCARLKFIQDSGWYSDEDKIRLAEKSAESFLRKLNRMRKAASSDAEREKLREICRNFSLIPEGCHLSFKARIILMYIKRL